MIILLKDIKYLQLLRPWRNAFFENVIEPSKLESKWHNIFSTLRFK